MLRALIIIIGIVVFFKMFLVTVGILLIMFSDDIKDNGMLESHPHYAQYIISPCRKQCQLNWETGRCVDELIVCRR